MNIAIIHGGKRTREVREVIEGCSYHEGCPKLVAVAVQDEEGYDDEWVSKARDAGLSITSDCQEILNRTDLDLIIDLRDEPPLQDHDERGNQKNRAQVLSGKIGHNFMKMLHGLALAEKVKQELEGLRILHHAAINAFFHEDVLLISRNYGILDANETLLNRVGLTRDEVVGKHCYEISHNRTDPCDGIEHPCPLKRCIGEGEHSQTTHVHMDKKGRKLYFSISCYPVFENGVVVGAVEISKDITRDILMEKNLYHQEKLVSVGHLAAGVAHEINNPLTTILTTAMLIQEDMKQEDPNYGELRMIVDEALRCRKIVTSLLDFARQSKPTKALQDLNQTVRETMTLTKKKAAFQDVQFEAVLEEDLPAAYVDKDQIQQSLINLALNAIEASEPGSKIRFSTRLLPDKTSVEITVEDSGKGIPESDLDMIFDPFFTTKENGTGLGLAITHGIIQRHGGSIEVMSKENQGTTFRIQIPIHRGDEDVQ
jgi:two-component system, NtrC family, sensor kinase